MAIYKLLSEKRDSALKVKEIRKNGFVPAIVYGHNFDSLGIQIKQDVVTKFLRTHSIGSKVLLSIDGKEQLVIFKDVHSDPLIRMPIHMDFHALTSGEKVKVTLPINYMNKDSLEQATVLHEQMSEIEIATLPKFLVDHVNVDVSKYSLGDSVFVRDLDISSDVNIEVISPQESQVCIITHAAKFAKELPEDEEETDEAAISIEE